MEEISNEENKSLFPTNLNHEFMEEKVTVNSERNEYDFVKAGIKDNDWK